LVFFLFYVVYILFQKTQSPKVIPRLLTQVPLGLKSVAVSWQLTKPFFM